MEVTDKSVKEQQRLRRTHKMILSSIYSYFSDRTIVNSNDIFVIFVAKCLQLYI